MTCEGTCSTCGDLCSAAEREQRVAERDRLQRQSARLNSEAATFCDRLQAAHEERDNAAWEAANLANDNVQLQEARDRLAAVLAETEENFYAMTKAAPGGLFASDCRAILADQRARAASPPPPRKHHDRCEAEADHPHDCATATRLAQLTAFAEDIRDGWTHTCPQPGDPPPGPLTAEEHDPPAVECWPCLAQQALEPPR